MTGPYFWSCCRAPIPCTCTFLTHWNISWNKSDTLLLCHLYIHFPNTYLFISLVIRKPIYSNNGPIWSKQRERITIRKFAFIKQPKSIRVMCIPDMIAMTETDTTKTNNIIFQGLIFQYFPWFQFYAYTMIHFTKYIYTVCSFQFNLLSIIFCKNCKLYSATKLYSWSLIYIYIYIYDTRSICIFKTPVAFADDTNLFFFDTDLHVMTSNISNAL